MSRFALEPMPVPQSETDWAYLQRQALAGQLSALMAHEYNNLMTPVLARAQYALMRDDVEAMRKALTVTVEQTQQAIAFTRCVLDMGRQAPLTLEPCGVRQVLDQAVLSLVRPFEKDGIEFVVDVPEDAQVVAHPLALQQLLANLLARARVAMEQLRGRLRVTATRDGDDFVLEFIDTSDAPAAHVLDEVINPFFESSQPLDAPPVEIDLTLLVCKMLADQLGGRLRFARNPETGLTARLELQAVD